MARRHTSRFVRPAPRTKMWIGAGVGLSSGTGNDKVQISTLSGGALLLRPFTILRTRMELWFASDQAAVGESPQGDYGRIVVTDTAAALGVTAIPDPSSTDGNPEADWFVHQAVSCQIIVSTVVGFVSPGAVRYTIDSKAMRKVGPDDDEVGMFAETGNFGWTLITRGRQLIQLH